MADSVRDEFLDICEGFTCAEDNEERFEHVVDVVDRHKGHILAVGGAVFLQNRIFGATARKAAVSSITALRAQEAAKWGKRAF